MSKQLENKRTMYEAILSLLKANAGTYASYPAIVTSVGEFEGLVSSIAAKAIEVGGATAGKTATKYSAEDNLIAELLPISSALFTWARREKNTDVKERTDVTDSGLRRIRDTDLLNRATEIQGLAVQYADKLTGHGITAATITDLLAKVTAYRDSLGARESSIAERSGARQVMLELIDQADELLEDDIDRNMELLRQNEAQFYNQYFAARDIKNMGAARKKPEPDTGGSTTPTQPK